MKCIKCNAELKEGAKFCDSCGATQQPEAAPQQPGAVPPQVPAGAQKSRTVYQILALLLGHLGIHNFYAGYVVRGIIQLLLCWTGISAIWALIEVFVVSKDAKGVPMRPSKLLLVLIVFVLVLGGAFFAFRFYGVLLYNLENLRMGNVHECENNMKAYGNVVMMYMNDHRSRIPRTGEIVDGKYLPSGAPIASCPGSKTHDGYTILGSGLEVKDLGIGRADVVPLLIERPGSHLKRHGRTYVNVMFLDGHVEYFALPNEKCSSPRVAAQYILDRNGVDKSSFAQIDKWLDSIIDWEK